MPLLFLASPAVRVRALAASALALSLISPVTTAAETATVQISESIIRLPAPAGFREISAEFPATRRIVETTMGPTNRLLGVFVSEADWERLGNGERPDMQRFFAAEVSRASQLQRLSASQFVQAKETLRNIDVEAALEAASSTIPGLESTSEQQSGVATEIALSAGERLGVFDETPYSLSYTDRTTVSTAFDEQEAVKSNLVTTTTLTLIDGRLLQLVAVSVYEAQDDRDWAENAVQQWYATLRAANAPYSLPLEFGGASDAAEKDFAAGNYQRAFKRLRRLAKKGDAQAQTQLGYLYLLGAGTPAEPEEAKVWLTAAAEQEIAAAQYQLGNLYRDGVGVDEDLRVAANWYRQAAEQDHAEAQRELGIIYRDGRGLPLNISEAISWFQLAADQGDAIAQLVMGGAYLGGYSLPQDDKEGARWVRLSAEQGYAPAQFNFGILLRRGQGVPKDATESAEWLLRAAEQDHVNAQFHIGVLYRLGEGVPEDPVQAVKWTLRAANQGHLDAQLNIGLSCYHGHGTQQDYDQAIEWFRKAAGKGHADAQYNLGVIYETGAGAPQDWVEAYVWYKAAIAQNHEEAISRGVLLSTRMSDEQRAEGDRRYEELDEAGDQ